MSQKEPNLVSAPNTSNEIRIFKDLERLTHSPGYAHVLAALCYKHKFLSPDSAADNNTKSRTTKSEKLIQSEIRILIGLFSKTKRNSEPIESDAIEEMMRKTESLCAELHETIIQEFRKSVFAQKSSPKIPTEKTPTDGAKVAFFREAMIYSGESAYTFQYRDLSSTKYAHDNKWMTEHKGFSITDACAVYDAIMRRQAEKLSRLYDETNPELIPYNKVLDMFTISMNTIVNYSGLPLDTVTSVVEAFSMRGYNKTFDGPSDYNAANATPLIPLNDFKYIIFELHILAESLYESPFYWMMEDKSYSDIHTNNRGRFTETLCADRLRYVFGINRVHTNIEIPRSRSETSTEIDVLAHFADRVVLVQAKSKRLTIDARRGNIDAIERDFQKGIQHASNQADVSARLLLDDRIREEVAKRCGIELSRPIQEIFVLNVLSDHYPALFIQVTHYLDRPDRAKIGPPLVIDVFALDVLTEILGNPLYFLSYLKRRSLYNGRVSAAQELTVLSYHLSHNLWMNSDTDWMGLDDGFSSDLDSVMTRRRCFGEQSAIPEGILTRFRDTTVGTILQALAYRDDPVLFELGLRILEMSENALRDFDLGCKEIVRRTKRDAQRHDFSLSMASGQFGVTVHCNLLLDDTARDILRDHCERRKYDHRSRSWLGLCLSSVTGEPRFGLKVDGPWEYSEEMEQKIKVLAKPTKSIRSILGVAGTKRKVGRNEPCPCGSGQKYKKCCLSRDSRELATSRVSR